MYYSYYGLKENAFKITPDPRFLFLSETHKEALAALVYGLEEGHTFLLLTGEVGTGKTIVLESFRANVDKNVKVILLANPTLSSDEFFYILTRRFGLEGDSLYKARLLEHLETAEDDKVKKTPHTLLIFDEAQALSHDLFEELRLLSNLNPSILQIFLVGQPELKERLALKECKSMDQRIGIRCDLRPMDRSETEAYIQHRLKVAGTNNYRAIFRQDALDLIFTCTGGIPRVINNLCDQVLITGFAENVRQIPAHIVKQTIDALGRDGGRENRKSKKNSFYKFLFTEIKPLSAKGLILLVIFFVIIIAAFLFIERMGNKTAISMRHTTELSPALPAIKQNTETVRNMAEIEEAKQIKIPVPENSRNLQDESRGNPPVNSITSSIPAEAETKDKPEQLNPTASTTDNNLVPAQQAQQEISTGPLSPPSLSAPELEVIRVNQDDTMARLIQNYYGQFNETIFRKVTACNPHIKNPDKIYPGEKLNFPKKIDTINSGQ
jgi:general secretion pathway protein A